MAKSYYIPGAGHYTDNEDGKQFYIPGAGHFTSTSAGAPTATGKSNPLFGPLYGPLKGPIG
jgi:hypothetical protein